MRGGGVEGGALGGGVLALALVGVGGGEEGGGGGGGGEGGVGPRRAFPFLLGWRSLTSCAGWVGGWVGWMETIRPLLQHCEADKRLLHSPIHPPFYPPTWSSRSRLRLSWKHSSTHTHTHTYLPTYLVQSFSVAAVLEVFLGLDLQVGQLLGPDLERVGGWVGGWVGGLGG